MINMHIKFEVSSVSRFRDILGGLKFKMGHVTWPRPFQGRFVIRRLGLAMFNSHILSLKCPRLPATKKLKATPNVTCFEPPFGGLSGNAQCSSMARWKAHYRLPIGDN